MTEPAAAVSPDALAGRLTSPVRDALAGRVEQLRARLPARPDESRKRHAWLCGLTPDEQRQAALLDRLIALRQHLDGEPALGYAREDLLPSAALEEAEGFSGKALDVSIADYRQARASGRPGRSLTSRP